MKQSLRNIPLLSSKVMMAAESSIGHHGVKARGEQRMGVTGSGLRIRRIRRARPEEAERLTALIRRSKAHWGYDAALLDAWRPDLTLDRETIARDPVYCAEDTESGIVLGVSHFYGLNTKEVYLDHLFVEPASIGQGVRSALWRHAIARVRRGSTCPLVL